MKMKKRSFIKSAGVAGLGVLSGCKTTRPLKRRPNVVYVFADQWRASAMGYAGDPNVKTPNLDVLASESFRFKNAVSCCPVCSPARASMITGEYPLTHGVFVNDVHLQHKHPSIADCFDAAGYQTGYIGKWHINGQGRSKYIPPKWREGFKFFQTLECTHDYNHSLYYDNNDPQAKLWKGYDAFDETTHATRFIQENKDRPFLLFLSWGPPHAPYETAPEKFRKMYNPSELKLHPNVPTDREDFVSLWFEWDKKSKVNPIDRVRQTLAGYYAHCSALDACVGRLQDAIRDAGLEENTVFVFTSDHGDMLGSHGLWKKQWPYDESALIPFLLKYPQLSQTGRDVDAPFDTPDIMPTLCGLCDIPVPSNVQGESYAQVLSGGSWPKKAALIANYQPFGQWSAPLGGKEWRGIRTERYTYVRDLNGPWLLFDNQADPFQQHNLVNIPEYIALQQDLNQTLNRKLAETHDTFADGMSYIKKWGYQVDETGTVPFEL